MELPVRHCGIVFLPLPYSPSHLSLLGSNARYSLTVTKASEIRTAYCVTRNKASSNEVQ